MNPVCSYHDFLEFLKYSSDNNDKLVPVFLIKPSTMLYLNCEYFLDRHFDYFDSRSGQNVQFFLPGYAHYPDIAFDQIFPNVRPYTKDAVALTTRRLGKIYYSESAFVDFVERIEHGSQNFIYRGDAELFFIKYLANNQHEIGSFDFTNIHRYNLSELFLAQSMHDVTGNERLIHITHFLEDVIFEIRNASKNENELIDSINTRYRMQQQ